MMPQNTTEWHPTPKQAAVLEAAQEAGLNRSIVSLCEAACVDRKSFYRWLKDDPDFKAAWEDIWIHSVRRHMPGVVAAVIAKAQDGDVPAARLIADLAGVTRQRIDAAVHQSGTVELKHDVGDRLEPYLEIIAEMVRREPLQTESETEASK